MKPTKNAGKGRGKWKYNVHVVSEVPKEKDWKPKVKKIVLKCRIKVCFFN
jgi:hypothetical protein